MIKICPTPNTTKGFDASHWQGIVNWQQKKLQGNEFGLIKAEDVHRGQIVGDDQFQNNWTNAKRAGVLRGAYAFFHPSFDPIKQADNLVRLTGNLVGDLPCIIDWEVTDGTLATKDRDNGYMFLTEVYKLTKKLPFIYGSPYFLQALALDRRFNQFPLWVAHYGVACPLVPPPWSTWTMWQWTDANGLDRNLFNGGLAQLKLLAG